MRHNPPLTRRFLPVLLAVATAAALAVAGPAAPASAAADPAVTQRAAQWLAGQLSPQGTVVGSYPGPDGQPVAYTDWGRTLDAALALLAAGGQDEVLGRTLTSVEAPAAVREYTQGAPNDRADAAYVGATAKLALVVALTGGDPTNVGGIDLIAQLLSLVTAEGRLADRSSFGNFANVFGHAFALLALDAAGRVLPQELVQGLLAVQCPDGSFPEQYQPAAGSTCTGQVDATGLVLQALAAVDLGTSDAAQRARTWLQGQQRADGSFPGEAPVNSTGYAAMGLDAVGAPNDAAVSYLVSQQNSDGGLRRGAGTSTASDLYATAQALPALAGKTFLESRRTIARQPLPSPSPSSPAPSTSPPTSSPSPVAPHTDRPAPCASLPVVVPERSTIVATEAVGVTVRALAGSVVELHAYSRPSTTFRVVRTGTAAADGTVSFLLRPPTNTRLFAHQVGCGNGASVVVNVRTALSITPRRNGTRDYTFSGRSFPPRAGGLIVSLYRVTPAGQSVLTAQTRANPTTGAWSIRRVFTGTGRFGFVVRTGTDLQNAAGTSLVRPVVIS